MYVKLHNIHKQFGKSVIFHDMNLEFSKCGLYFLTGASGSGKTTLLNIIAGYEPVKGMREVSSDASISCIFQSYELIEELNIRDNIFLYHDVFENDDTKYQDCIIHKLGLENVLDHYPKELSSGQQQRVGIARALLMHPNMIICDEPTESLDIENKEKVLQLLKELSKTMIVIIASHETDILEDYYDYHYEIYNKQVVCVEKRVDGTECIEVPIRKALNKKMANRYLGKMIRYNTYIYSGIFFMILLVSLLFTQIKNQVFKEREYTSALNYNVVYFSDIGGDDESLKKIIPANSIKQVYIQIPFSLWYYEGKSYKPDLFPYISNVCGVEITGKSQPEKDQIIINQYVADKMIEHLECSEEELLGKSLQFNYIIDKREYPITFVIAGIAHEQDVNGKMIIYYDYNYIMNLMKSQEYYPGMSFLDYLREYHRKYAFETNESLTSYSLFDQLDSRNLDAYHSIFSHLDSRGNQKEMYQVVFQMVQIILFILTILYVFFYVIKDMKKNSTNLSILVSMHLPIGFLRWQYFRIKFLAVIIVVAFAALEIYSYGYFFEDDQIFYQYYYLMGTLFLYFIVLAFTLHRFRTSKVSDILKDSKDK